MLGRAASECCAGLGTSQRSGHDLGARREGRCPLVTVVIDSMAIPETDGQLNVLFDTERSSLLDVNGRWSCRPAAEQHRGLKPQAPRYDMKTL
ncbi:hypothetical protein EVAR_41479_1 [Eumeta japonica]|uniref:Uncharacterized protein n=1 Tax=Eumeta variegata TaxID=151549 RepID=A0A4C1X104_EUMVA|nr:hypothetical protein EVAR_41479_1 [Eumeta japonica]